MKLVIVESPTKATTFKRYLGDEYEVKSSVGHIRDLATSGKGGFGVDVDGDFSATYIINKDKSKVVNDLKKSVKKADEVILATDPDREGEAIAWHLAEELGLDLKKTKRLEFHEITKNSINEALENPRTIDLDLVASQETRRIIDRISGFKLSGLVRKKLGSQSAGRVQSVALRLLTDLEKEIQAFEPEEYWTLKLEIEIDGEIYELNFARLEDEKIKIRSKEEMDEILKGLGEEVKVSNIEVSKKTTASKLPLTTSTLQQEASNRFRYNAKRTMFIAQQLYEGIEIDGEVEGLITYMRTDSTRLSDTFIKSGQAYIYENFGKDYVGSPKQKKAKKGENVQDAHEAIRPTSVNRAPKEVKSFLSQEQYNVYRLIYARALGSLMSNKIEEVTKVTLLSNDLEFNISGTRLVFPGYKKVIGNLESNGDKEIPAFTVGETHEIITVNAEQKFTQPPSRYSEGRLIRTLEEQGIGRPSTYVPIIETLKDPKRNYVKMEKGALRPTEQGILTADTLTEHFPEFMDTQYTADMESELDKVANGDVARFDVLKEFYTTFTREFDKANENIEKVPPKETGETCPSCGTGKLVYRTSRYGEFIGCSNYPSCKYTKYEHKRPEPKKLGRECPSCGGDLVERVGRRGKTFVGCSNFPKCNYNEGLERTNKRKQTYTEADYVKECPTCQEGHLVVKDSYRGKFLGCSRFPKCRHTESLPEEES